MTAPLTAEASAPTVADVLTYAADALAALRHPRVSTVDVTRTVRRTAALLLDDSPSAYGLACRSLDVLIAHRAAIGEDPAALDRWTGVFGRDAMAEQMRAAAQATTGQAVTR